MAQILKLWIFAVAVLFSTMSAARGEFLGLRAVPNFVSGNADGFKIMGLTKSNQKLHLASLQNGDIILEIDGIKLEYSKEHYMGSISQKLLNGLLINSGQHTIKAVKIRRDGKESVVFLKN